MPVKDVVEEKLELLRRSPVQFVDAMQNIARAIIDGDDRKEHQASMGLAKLLGETMMLADAVGRRRLLLEHDALAKRQQPSTFRHGLCSINFGSTPVFPRVNFTEAFDDLMGRDPRLANNADEIRRAYSGDQGFAILKLPRRLAEHARLKLTERVRDMLAGFLGKGVDRPTAKEQLQAVAGFSSGYAETVYRTNLATAFTAGRMQQMKDPDIRATVPAFELVTVGDSDVRKNHRDGEGLIAAVGDPVWRRHAPPLGYQCRCDLRSVDKFELQSRGLLMKGGHVQIYYPANFASAGPDPGFRNVRPDEKIYGS